MSLLDRERLDAIANALCDRLDGDWLLIGGAIVALWFEPRRTTEDIDVIGLRGTSSERLSLMELAESLGLPIEAVNSAADFFVQRIDDWREQLVLFRSGKRARIFRPSATLFLLLKLRRLDEQDLEDCRGLLAIGEPFDRERVLGALSSLPAGASAALAERREELRRLVAGA